MTLNNEFFIYETPYIFFNSVVVVTYTVKKTHR